MCVEWAEAGLAGMALHFRVHTAISLTSTNTSF
jgi:hypothetical protein